MIVEPNQTLCSPSEQLAFSIVAAGNALCDSNWHATELSPPYTRLYYILDGTGEVETQQGPLHLTAGMLYMLPVGYSFSYHCADRMHQLYFHIHLTNPCGADLLRGIDRILTKPFSSAYMKQLLTLLRTDSVVSRGNLKALLLADVFSLLSNHRIDIQNKQLSEVVQKTLTFVSENLSASLTAKTIADKLYVSPTTVSHKFKAEMEIPLGKYIDDLVMHRAELLLINTNIPLSSISEELGFCDQFYFSRRFKEKYAISPLKYRKAHHLVK